MDSDEFSNFFKSPVNYDISYVDIIQKIYEHFTNNKETKLFPILIDVILSDIRLNSIPEYIIIKKFDTHNFDIYILPEMKFLFHFTGENDIEIIPKTIIDLLNKISKLSNLIINNDIVLTSEECVNLYVTHSMNHVENVKSKEKLYMYTDESYIRVVKASDIINMDLINNDKFLSSYAKSKYDKFKNINPDTDVIKFHFNICERPDMSKLIKFQ